MASGEPDPRPLFKKTEEVRMALLLLLFLQLPMLAPAAHSIIDIATTKPELSIPWRLRNNAQQGLCQGCTPEVLQKHSAQRQCDPAAAALSPFGVGHREQ